jgi:hypothetical protein
MKIEETGDMTDEQIQKCGPQSKTISCRKA